VEFLKWEDPNEISGLRSRFGRNEFLSISANVELSNMNWDKFKTISEREFKYLELESNVYGYQMQPGTRWNNGLLENDLEKLESRFGFKFPVEYRNFLKVMNGIDTDLVYIDPDGLEEDRFFQLYYEYPKDFGRSMEQVNEIHKNLKYVHEALVESGFCVDEIEGYVPTFAHRALVVFSDKSLSPVVSVWGSDVVVLARNICDYWKIELGAEGCFF
jgi:hypothetical protein